MHVLVYPPRAHNIRHLSASLRLDQSAARVSHATIHSTLYWSPRLGPNCNLAMRLLGTNSIYKL